MSIERLTVVVAAFNEAEALPALHPRIAAVLDALAADGVEGCVLYVDDGSRDRTWAVLDDIATVDLRVSLLRLSRNFGKEAALTAGLDRVIEHSRRRRPGPARADPAVRGEMARGLRRHPRHSHRARR
jgi:polyisoprenyl-phosphate glycosyltransferase